MTLKENLLNLKYKLLSNKKTIKYYDTEKDNGYLCKASEIGKIVVNKCLKMGIKINTQKLEKLLVLIQSKCIEDSGLPLFGEDILIWDCGVIIKEVDGDFREYSIEFDKYLNEKIVLLNSEKKYINDVLEKYGNLAACDLNKLCLGLKNITFQLSENKTLEKNEEEKQSSTQVKDSNNEKYFEIYSGIVLKKTKGEKRK